MMSKQDLRRKFQEIISSKPADMFRLGRDLHEILSFMESTIKKQFESFSLLSFSICGSEKRFKIDPQYEAAFISLSLEEQIMYFQAASNAIAGKNNETNEQNENLQGISIKAVKGIKSGQIYKIIFSNSYAIDCSNYQISLNKYILRKSKKHQNMYIYEAIEKTEPTSIRFQLIDNYQLNEEIIFKNNYQNYKQYISQLANRGLDPDKAFKISKNRAKQTQRVSPTKHSILNTENNFDSITNNKADNDDRSVTHEILQCQQGFSEQIHQLVERKEQEIGFSGKKRWSKNVAKIIVPHLSLVDVENLNDCLPIHSDQVRRMYIYKHTKIINRFAMELHIKQPADLVVKHLGQIQNYKLWHKSINESHIKLSISSDNAYIMYLKQKSYSQWFRQRDFLFLRHLCKVGNNYYFIDFSVQNSHFFPFQSIFRGVINHSIMKIQQSSLNESRVVFQLQIDYGGLLPSEGKNELTLAFLKGFGDLQSFINRYKGGFKSNFDFNWEICLSNQQSQPTDYLNGQSFRDSSIFNQQLQPISSTSRGGEDSQEFYSIQDNDQRQPIYEITEQEMKNKRQKVMHPSIHQQNILVNQEGLILLPNNYINIKHQVAPFQVDQRKKQLPYSNLMIKQDFSVDKLGGLILTNKQKIAAQDNVIKFIMSTLKKNLFSGKGILNISLPVEIFNIDSNLQRVCQSLSFAPDLIERKGCQAKDVQRFKQCVAFAFTNSVLYFDIQKPFNPILGETFQGFINGCPVYAEQISHHPPITSFYFVGRGYKIYGNLQSKVYVHLNSGDGVNQGFYTIQFNDGSKVLFQTCPGQLSGLAMGERKFRFNGKSYIIDAKNRLFCSLNFQDQSGMFSKNKWQYVDQIDGEIVRVKQQFIRKFFQTKQGKDAITPKQKDIEARLGKISGRWIEALLIDGKEYFNLTNPPQEMVHYNFPLVSNSNYREDLYYRKLNDLARSQNEKERLEVLQRLDRKLREKLGPKVTKH